MSPILLYVSMTLALTIAVVLHAAQVLALARGRERWSQMTWCVLPGVATVVAWREGERLLPVALLVTALLYAALWAPSAL